MKAITPDEVCVTADPRVVEIMNALIQRHYSSGSSKVYQKDVILALSKHPSYSQFAYAEIREDIFGNRLLDIEEFYRQAGWSVVYHKPAYDESFAAYWVFKRKHPSV